MKSMRLTIGIILCSLFIGVHAVDSVDLQYHSTIFQQIEWTRLRKLPIERISLRMFLDLPVDGGLFFKNRNFRVIENRLNSEYIPFLKQENTPKIFGWLIARKYNWIGRREWFDMSLNRAGRKETDKIDLFNPDAVDAVVATFADLAMGGVDGVLIQDDLMLRSLEGFSNWGRAAYTVQTGLPVDPVRMMTNGTVEQQNWNRVKLNQISLVVNRIVCACKAVNPKCVVVMNVYYETPLKTEFGEAWYAQNLAELMQTGLDEIVLMAYHRQMALELGLQPGSRELMERFRTMLQKAQRMCGDRLRVKFQIRDWVSGEMLPVEEILAMYRLAPEKIEKISLTPVRPGDLDWVESLLAGLGRRSS